MAKNKLDEGRAEALRERPEEVPFSSSGRAGGSARYCSSAAAEPSPALSKYFLEERLLLEAAPNFFVCSRNVETAPLPNFFVFFEALLAARLLPVVQLVDLREGELQPMQPATEDLRRLGVDHLRARVADDPVQDHGEQQHLLHRVAIVQLPLRDELSHLGHSGSTALIPPPEVPRSDPLLRAREVPLRELLVALQVLHHGDAVVDRLARDEVGDGLRARPTALRVVQPRRGCHRPVRRRPNRAPSCDGSIRLHDVLVLVQLREKQVEAQAISRPCSADAAVP